MPQTIRPGDQIHHGQVSQQIEPSQLVAYASAANSLGPDIIESAGSIHGDISANHDP